MAYISNNVNRSQIINDTNVLFASNGLTNNFSLEDCVLTGQHYEYGNSCLNCGQAEDFDPNDEYDDEEEFLWDED